MPKSYINLISLFSSPLSCTGYPKLLCSVQNSWVEPIHALNTLCSQYRKSILPVLSCKWNWQLFMAVRFQKHKRSEWYWPIVSSSRIEELAQAKISNIEIVLVHIINSTHKWQCTACVGNLFLICVLKIAKVSVIAKVMEIPNCSLYAIYLIAPLWRENILLKPCKNFTWNVTGIPLSP